MLYKFRKENNFMGKFERALQDERLMNFLGIDDEDKKELLKMHKEQNENK